MKKTIALLCAMAAAVAQADTTPYTLTTTITGTENQQERYLVINDVTGTTAIAGNSILTAGNVAWNPAYYIPNVNVGNGGTWTATLSYTLPSDVTSFTLSSIDITGVGCNSGGGAQTANNDRKVRGVNYTVTVISGDTSTEVGTASWTGVLNDQDDDCSFAASTITLTDALELTGDFQLVITATREAENGCFFGLKDLTLTGTTPVPEPTTATLSLLALAGLAARRRRK